MRENVVSYKYDYAAKKSSGLYLTKKKAGYLLLAFVLFLGFGFNYMTDGAWFHFMIAVIVWIVSIFAILGLSGKKRLYITPRYLLCGDDIVYFHNVTAIDMQAHSGQITIHTPNTILTLNRDDFPTNAQKEHKIAANKEEKFRKVSDKIIKRVKATNPTFMINAPAQHPNIQPPNVQPPKQTRVRDLSRY